MSDSTSVSVRLGRRSGFRIRGARAVHCSAFCCALAWLGVSLLVAQQTGAITGQVADPTGAVVPRAQIQITTSAPTTTKLTRNTTTDSLGRFTISGLEPGDYDITVTSPGFAKKIQTVKLFPSQAMTVNFTLPIGSISTPIDVSSGELSSAFWNAWAEDFQTPDPTFVSTPNLQPDSDYLFVLDLAAIRYTRSAGVFTAPASTTLTDYLKRIPDAATTLTVLLIPDERFFQPQSDPDRVAPLTIDLNKMRAVAGRKFDLQEPPLDMLHRKQSGDPFSFARHAFKIHTKTRTGWSSIALSIWAKGLPVDELVVPLCVAVPDGSGCTGAPVVRSSALDGVDSVRVALQRANDVAQLPDLALHFVEFQSGSITGVLRCNTCPDWRPDEFYTWWLGRSVVSLSEDLNATVLTAFEDAANSEEATGQFDADSFTEAGKALYRTLFRNGNAPTTKSQAQQKFEDIVRTAASATGPPKSLFVRLLPHDNSSLFMIPLGLAAVTLGNGKTDFLGFRFRIESPLQLQDYTAASSCISKWVLMIPPDSAAANPPTNPGLVPDDDLAHSLPPAKGSLDGFRTWGNSHVSIFNLTDFRDWLEDSEAGAPTDVAIMTLSHHDNNRLFFNKAYPSPAILSRNITRPFSTTSLALINACGTARPGAWDFVRTFNQNGMSAVIATSTEVDATMAGTFFAIFTRLLQNKNGDTTYTIANARFDAVVELSQTKSQYGNPYGPRALVYSLLGNGNLRVCAPPANGATVREVH